MRPARRAAVPVLLLVLGASAGCTGEPTEERTTASSAAQATSAGAGSGTPPAAVLPPERAPQAELDRALRQAAWDDRVADAAELLRRGADVNAKDETEQSAYLIATSQGHVELLDLALRHGAAVDDKDSWNGTGLIRAAERGHALVVGRLLRAGIERDHVNRIGYQAVHEAVWLGRDDERYVDTLRVLVAGGVELDRPSQQEGLTPLEMAGQRGHSRLEAVLRVAPLAPSRSPGASLLVAAAEGDADAVAGALRVGANLETRDERGRTALTLAATHDRVDVARLLVAMGADPDARDDQHDTPWLVTGVTGSVAMLEALLPAHPDLTLTNRYGGVSLIPASERGHVGYVRRVVRTGIDVNHVNNLGWTALLEAVILGDGGRDHQEVVRILLDAGAEPSIADRGGKTPLDHATARGQAEVEAILRAHR